MIIYSYGFYVGGFSFIILINNEGLFEFACHKWLLGYICMKLIVFFLLFLLPLEIFAENKKIEAIAAPTAKFGFAVSYNALVNNSTYSNIIKNNAKVIVPENDLKWRFVQPEKNQYNFKQSDYIINFALFNNKLVRGHTLVWHSGIPQYVTNESDPKVVEKLLRDHISTVVGRYKGKIQSWDVVNEIIHIPDIQQNGMRNSYWYKILGEKYIDIAFDAAHKADPNAILVYNEWGTEYDTKDNIAKREAVISLIKRLKQRNVPIHGFGLQSHLSTKGANFLGNGLPKFIQQLHDLGLKIYVTELDVIQSQENTSKHNYSVTETYRKYLELVLAGHLIEDVMVWGVFDRVQQMSRSEQIKPQLLYNINGQCNDSCEAVSEFLPIVK